MKINGINKALFTAAIAVPFTTMPLVSCNKKIDDACHLLTINDLHGAAVGFGDKEYPLNVSAKNPGVERLANFLTDFRESHPNTMFLSGGDANSGDCFSTATHGATMYPLLSAMDMVYSAVGNHEFEWGIDGYLEDSEHRGNPGKFDAWARTDKTEGKYFVTSNILNGHVDPKKEWSLEGEAYFESDYELWATNRVKWADPYKIINIDGKHKICLIGLTTTAAAGDPNPEKTKDLSFIDYVASVNYARHAARLNLGEDEFNKIDAFVLLTHTGSDFTKEGVVGESAEIAKKLNVRVDAILSAHTHKEGVGVIRNEKLGNNIWIGQGNTAGRAILDTRLQFDDTKSEGQRLSGVSMAIYHAPINIGNDPSKPNIDIAESELNNLRAKASTLAEDSPLAMTVKEYAAQRNELIEKFEEEVGKGITAGEKYPAAEHKEALGHQYIWPSDYSDDPSKEYYMVEEMGAWACYAMIKGMVEIEKSYGMPEIVPSIGLINFDSITQQFLLSEGQDSRPITYGDLFQLQTYENPMYIGYLTIGQICNLINYMLAGEGVFDYETKPSYCDNEDLDVDFVTRKHYGIEGGIDDGYVCAPPQFWGVKFQTRSDPKYDDKGRIIRNYSLDFVKDDDGWWPRLWLYDANSNGCHLEDPDTWVSAKDLWEKYNRDYYHAFPFTINKFTYDGNNHQLVMMQKYMKWNEASNPSKYPILSFGEFSRDAIMKYCESIKEIASVDFTKEWAHKLVEFPENP